VEIGMESGPTSASNWGPPGFLEWGGPAARETYTKGLARPQELAHSLGIG
jgi:hypothetical protein